MILLSAFSNHWGTNISHRTLLELQKNFSPDLPIDYQFIYFHPKNFFEKHIKNSCHNLIIALGDGSKFLTKIKIETQAKNAYLNKPIQSFAPILIDLNMPPVEIYDPNFFKIGTSMGEYNCNWLAYQTQYYLNSYSPDTLHLFLHLPPKMSSTLAASHIRQLLIDNQLI